MNSGFPEVCKVGAKGALEEPETDSNDISASMTHGTKLPLPPALS